MASDVPPGADPNVDFNAWTHGELQAKLAEFGAPNMGPREELIDRLKSYAQSGMILTKPNMSGGDAKSMTTMPGLPPMPPMPSMPLPPGMNMMQAMNMMGGPPPIHMGIEPPGMMQQDDRATQGDARVMDEQMKEQELLEQQKRAAVLLEHERQQELAKIQQGAAPGTRGPELGPRPNLLPPIPPLRVGTLSGPAPPGVSMMPQSVNQRQKVPPPPGEDGRESWQGEDVGIGPKIPQALEKILQLKEMRQEQLSTAPTEEDDDEQTGEMDLNSSSARGFSDEDDESGLSKKDKNRKRRNRKKNKKKRQQEKEQQEEEKKKEESRDKEPEVEIEYVTEEPAIYDPSYIIFKRIFETFKLTDDLKKEKEKEPEKPEKPEILSFKKKGFELEKKDSDDSDEENKKDMPKLSKKKLRRMNRLTVAELKQLVARPDVVEMHDVTAQEPKLLVHLKASRNTVPVPRHWCFKRKYLQGKRGIEKPPFELPEFIKRTGIQEMREALQEKEDAKTMKTKMREKVRPKMGKIDIDYQKLHDAFFKWQIKPKLTIHGDLYYEGKEFETRLKEKKPGDLSAELRIALGMPTGPNSHKVPPPWLIAMQRYGPPPSYPNLKIPGLNAPIPEGCSFGYHAGGWGKPPVDETGRPLYGDVFGTNAIDFQAKAEEEEVDRTPWGELEASDEESSEEEEEEESDEEKPDETGFFTPADSGMITPGGFSSVPAGMETPELIELRKKKIEEAMDGNETPQLFTVLPERKAGAVGAAMMASTHIYDMSTTVTSRKVGGVSGLGGDSQAVEVALAPEELELDPMAMTQKYEEHVREQQVEKEDFSDMVAEHAAKQKQKKRKSQPQDTRSGAKKYKEFKF
ncbi:splicing factor 3B subunit 2 isoform X2 [Sinocyclocheilus anshuiensis]|uniref:Splicing factor 3B subunit 2-like n=2 Tax=Sinocyclocheilus anshuiensis TaxID=1608454 RepID=A0A671NEJ5_9TELE|nr:PREDICTED: splicing factor 3B subunit 2-like isoform X1 [Sinocyclocheilus anshuiensis]XP_016347532.1 PREDICTED: splicing factor 3B subunit 2-like isoform X2 [Sinocyclocheilus anshuiensis]